MARGLPLEESHRGPKAFLLPVIASQHLSAEFTTTPWDEAAKIEGPPVCNVSEAAEF